MTKITGLENIRELYDMWSRTQVATYKYEGLEVFGTKNRAFSRPASDEGVKEFVEKMTGKNLPIVGDFKWSHWILPNFSLMVEIDGTPAEVCFEFGADAGGESCIDADAGDLCGKISIGYGPNQRTPQFADFPGLVTSQTVDFTIKGMLTAHQVRRMYDHIRSELKDLADWFSFSNINSKNDPQFSAFCDQEKGWELSKNSSQDWSYESEMWAGRFWSFAGLQNRPLTLEENNMKAIHKAMRDVTRWNGPQAGRVFSLDEIRRAEQGELESVVYPKAEEYRRAEMIAMRPENILRKAIKERDEEIARKKAAEEARAEAERIAAEKKERERQETYEKLKVFLESIGDFEMHGPSSHDPDGDEAVGWLEKMGARIIPFKECWHEAGYGFWIGSRHTEIILLQLHICYGFDQNVQDIIKWMVDNGAREPEPKSEAA